MALVKTVLLIDGENLTLRYQDMVSQGRKPKSNVIHIPNIFVWHRGIFKLWELDFFRILFYSSVVGDEDKIKQVEETISNQIFDGQGILSTSYFGKLQIVPWIFKKASKSYKSRLVDINITIDSMRFAYTNAVDALCFISGDGDFLNLYAEIMRNGKKVSVAALSSGLSKSIKTGVDEFIDLDTLLFEAP
ncbi:MAG: NYN domain-containing protein [Aestuariibacter sp.]|nr:NYN domain-containing protein [Aestuariibacter sp.]